MTLDRRTAYALALLAWTMFMAWLWLSGESLRYLGPRTAWLMPVGAALLAVCLMARRRSDRRERAPARLSGREAIGLVATIAPILTAMLFANTQLGAQAASRKLASRGIDATALANLNGGSDKGRIFLQLDAASENAQFARRHHMTVGSRISMLGFVSRAQLDRRQSFELSRFYISCCVADSFSVGAIVRQPPDHIFRVRTDQWFVATGHLIRVGHRLALRADHATHVHPPPHPYVPLVP